MNTDLSKQHKELNTIHVVGISGSLRNASYNTRALRLALTFAKEAGANVTEVSLKDPALPMYDDDLMAKGTPESVLQLKSVVDSANVLLIASPEYNHSISGALKNAIDWLSRGNNSFNGKTAAIFGATPGIYGTIRGQFHLRQILTALNVYMVPQPQVLIGNAHTVFNADGTLNDKKLQDQLHSLIHKTISLAKALKD